jgi:hypothetical protein
VPEICRVNIKSWFAVHVVGVIDEYCVRGLQSKKEMICNAFIHKDDLQCIDGVGVVDYHCLRSLQSKSKKMICNAFMGLAS